MAKKKFGLTGISETFNLIVAHANNSYTVYEFNGGYSALEEYDWAQATRHVYWDGSKDKKTHFINREWVLVWDGLLYTEDGVKINAVKNAELDTGTKIYLMPHADEDISYPVQIIEEKRKLEKYRNSSSTSKNYTLAFENVSPILNYNWRDPSVKVYFTADEFDFV